MDWVTPGAYNRLSPIRCQAISWTNTDIVNWFFGNKIQWLQNTQIFFHGKIFENAVFKLAAILSGPDVGSAWKIVLLNAGL